MELHPLRDTAGAGLSLLDTILHTRVGLDGVVSRTVSRVAYVCKYSASASPQELCERQAQLLSDSDPEATGLLLVQARSFWGVLESSPETVAALFRWMAAESKISSCRVVLQIEDCPSRAFGPWSYRSVMLPSEGGTIDLDGTGPVAIATGFYQMALSIGTAVAESGGAALDHLAERMGGSLPSDERVCALADWSKLASCRDWLALFDSPPDFRPASEDTFPLPGSTLL